MADAWVRAARSRDVVGVPFTPVDRHGTTVLLSRPEDGTVVAFESGCPHTGNPLRRGFLTDDGCIECPVHFYRYDARTGRNVFPSIDETDDPLTRYETREEDGWIHVGPPRPAPE